MKKKRQGNNAMEDGGHGCCWGTHDHVRIKRREGKERKGKEEERRRKGRKVKDPQLSSSTSRQILVSTKDWTFGYLFYYYFSVSINNTVYIRPAEDIITVEVGGSVVDIEERERCENITTQESNLQLHEIFGWLSDYYYFRAAHLHGLNSVTGLYYPLPLGTVRRRLLIRRSKSSSNKRRQFCVPACTTRGLKA